MASDIHGRPPIVADHATAYEEVDATDWCGIWTHADALLACTFGGEWCEYALANTPKQQFMGEWSDGVPVAELEVGDD